jgi:hypothetical protein
MWPKIIASSADPVSLGGAFGQAPAAGTKGQDHDEPQLGPRVERTPCPRWVREPDGPEHTIRPARDMAVRATRDTTLGPAA